MRVNTWFKHYYNAHYDKVRGASKTPVFSSIPMLRSQDEAAVRLGRLAR